MPAVPFGGLSFILNVSIVLIGMLIGILEGRGVRLDRFRAGTSVFAGQRFDRPWRHLLGVCIMLATVSFLFASIAVSFARRFQAETNLDLLGISHSVDVNPLAHDSVLRNENPYNPLQ